MSSRKVYLAIDAHARNCVLGCMSARGEFERSWRFKTCEKELVEHVQRVDAGKKLLAIEEGPLSYWIAQTIRPYVDDVFIADPRKNPLISRNVMKNDKVDAAQLCRLLRLGELRRVYHPLEDHRAVFKASVQQYLDFRNQQTKLKQKLKAKFRGWGVPDVEGSKLYNPKRRGEFLSGIEQEPVRHQLQRLYDLLDEATRVQAEALSECVHLGRRYPEIQEFKKLPGVGDVGALTFDAYIQTPERFSSKSRLFRYCQLAVTDRSSDNKPLGFKRLDRAGNSELKAVSYRAFLSALRNDSDNEVRTFFDRSMQRTRNATHARLNTQRKIIATMYGLWKRGEAYRPEQFLGSE